MMQDEDIIREFLVESHENLSRLEPEIVELEKRPKDAALLAGIFRTFHTIKGTCGFLAFSILERITHQAETILSQLRDGQRDLTPALISLILETVDATRKVLTCIDATGNEGSDEFVELTERLNAAARGEQADAITGVECERAPSTADANIRVGVALLDKLMDLVGELVLTRNQILQFNGAREDAALNATSQRLNLITAELQEGIMKMRMQPIGTVWNTLPRIVRDVALALGKQVRLEMDGAETELDRTIIEAIKDPLIHLVRNACDHGMETAEARVRAGKPAQGRLNLRAYHEGGQVIIEIADDGAGIDIAQVKKKAIEKGLIRHTDKLSDREALNLIFHPGFSTAQEVTNISGRGVGMDVVKANIEKIGGIVEIFSRLGEGITVKLKIPLTLAIIPGLVVTSGGEQFIVPQASLLELIRLDAASSEKRIEHINGAPVYRRRGRLLPVAYLNDVLGLKTAEGTETVNMVVLQAQDRQFGLVVDGIHDTQEIVVKPLGKQLKGLTIYSGATIMGDGRVALILDVPGIGLQSGVLAGPGEQIISAAEPQPEAVLEQERLLLFSAGSFTRLAVPISLVARLEEIPQSLIEHAGGHQVVQYRNRILPLISLRSVLESSGLESLEPETEPPADPLQVIVFNDRDRSIGVVVDEILDIAEEAVVARQKATRKGLLGSAVVGQHVADFLDLNYVIRNTAEDWFKRTDEKVNRKKILIAEPSTFLRRLIRSSMDMAGYLVFEAASLDEAVEALERYPVDIVAAALDLPPGGCAALVEAMRRRRAWKDIPFLALADSAEQLRAQGGQPGAFQDCMMKSEQQAMLESLARLAAAIAEPVFTHVPTRVER